jgi:hypothetical protein
MRIRSWAKDDNGTRGACLSAAEYQGRQGLCCGANGGRSREGQHARPLPAEGKDGKVC